MEPAIRKVVGYSKKHIYEEQPTDGSEGYQFDVIGNTLIHDYLFKRQLGT